RRLWSAATRIGQPINICCGLSLNVARRRRSSHVVSYAVGYVGFRAVLRAVRATFRPVLRVARATFRPVLRVARATFRPVLRAVRAVLRAVVFLVAIVFLPSCFDVAPFQGALASINASLFSDFAVAHGKSITFFTGGRW